MVEDATRDFATRILRRFLRLCESPRTRKMMFRLVRGSTGNARTGRILYRMINRTVVNPVARATGVQASALKLELVASASVDEVIALAVPSIRATLVV